MSSRDEFFKENQQEHSLIKSNIVVDYFCAWATIIAKNRRKKPQLEQRICYADLYSGPGYFNDGTESTPLRIVREVIRNPRFFDIVECVFNDGDGMSRASVAGCSEPSSGIAGWDRGGAPGGGSRTAQGGAPWSISAPW